MLVVFVLEGLTIAVLATVAAPLIAAAAISLMGLTPAFSDLTAGSLLDVRLSAISFMLGAVGGVLGLVALVLPAFQVSRTGVIRHRQEAARPTALPAFQRYYVDVLLLIVSIYLFRQLTEQGSVVATDLLGESAVSELLLALPGLTLIAAAVVLLRIFPIAMNLAGRLLSGSIPAGLVMGIWQMARSPTHYARLSLLLILAAGLGIFASSFGATLDRSFLERVLHSHGRGREGRGRTGPQLHGGGCGGPVVPSTPGYRGSTRPRRCSGRADRSSRGLRESPSRCSASTQPPSARSRSSARTTRTNRSRPCCPGSNTPRRMGWSCPAASESLTVRIKPDRPHPGVRVTVQIRDADGVFRTLSLGRLASAEWEDLAAEVPEGWPDAGVLVSLRIHETDPFLDLQAGSLLVDEISVSTPGGPVTLESFDTVDWTPLLGTGEAISDAVRPASEVLSGEAGSALFTWSEGAPQTIRGIFKGSGRAPIPALASRPLVQDTGHVEGDEFEVLVAGHRVPILLAGVVDLFPTVTSRDGRYLVTDIDALTGYANMAALGDALTPNQVWLVSPTSGVERGRLVEDLRILGGPSTVVYDRELRLEETRVDPLVNAGWRSLLFLSFAAVLILSCIGFLVHAYVSYRNRLVQFALMRTVGVSVSQLITMVWVEQAMVVAVGMALGTWMGARLGAVIMPFLGHDDWGDRVVPPFTTEVDWAALLATYGLMFAVFAVITLGLVWLIRRISVHSVLRLGDA